MQNAHKLKSQKSYFAISHPALTDFRSKGLDHLESIFKGITPLKSKVQQQLSRSNKMHINCLSHELADYVRWGHGT